MTTKDLIISDFYRFHAEEFNKEMQYSILKIALLAIVGRTPALSYSFWFRIAQNCSTPILRLLGVVMHRHYSRKYHIDIKRYCKTGYGLYLSHGMCIVISGNTVIGNNVNISQFVNIGSNNPSEFATIGDNVYIGPHVSIVGKVSIGNNVTIGAGAVVTKDIPDNATVVGVPANVISFDDPARYIHNPYLPPSQVTNISIK